MNEIMNKYVGYHVFIRTKDGFYFGFIKSISSNFLNLVIARSESLLSCESITEIRKLDDSEIKKFMEKRIDFFGNEGVDYAKK